MIYESIIITFEIYAQRERKSPDEIDRRSTDFAGTRFIYPVSFVSANVITKTSVPDVSHWRRIVHSFVRNTRDIDRVSLLGEICLWPRSSRDITREAAITFGNKETEGVSGK